MARLFLTTSLITLLIISPIGASHAAPVIEPGKAASKPEAVQIVKRKYPGRVLKVEQVKRNGHSFYRVKLLSKQGKVHSVLVAARADKRRHE